MFFIFYVSVISTYLLVLNNNNLKLFNFGMPLCASLKIDVLLKNPNPYIERRLERWRHLPSLGEHNKTDLINLMELIKIILHENSISSNAFATRKIKICENVEQRQNSQVVWHWHWSTLYLIIHIMTVLLSSSVLINRLCSLSHIILILLINSC